MKQPAFSPKSLEDLDDILDRIAQDSPERAVSFVASLKEQCRMLAAFPGLGARREELARKLRLFPIGHYCIYYRVLDEGNVRIERVLHASRDVDAFLG